MLKADKTLVFTSWMLVEPAEDIPGIWVGHCLDFDVVSQGDNPQDAIASVTEAVAMTVVDDLQNGLDPNERRAPAEFWDRLARVLKHGEQVKISEVKGDSKFVLATQVTLVLERKVRQNSAEDFSQFNVPPAMAHVDQQVCAA
jgi:predicted RNase H-like HicB family nuclease